MRAAILSAIVSLLLVQNLKALDGTRGTREIRELIAAAVSERLGSVEAIEIDVLDAPAIADAYDSAAPAPGGRLGAPMRFTLSGTGVPSISVVARVSVVLAHVVVLRPIARDAAITADDVEVRRARLDGVLMQPLPTLDEVLAGRPRRALAAGETLTAVVIARALAVRAGDEVSITIRTGGIEARGVGRAASSGFLGDVIRVTRPGSRETARARVLAPSAVEILP